jgi:MFS family permease
MLAVATAVYGWVADLAGLRLPLVVGVAIMTAGALVGALPGSFELLLAARLMQGVGGGIGSAVVGGFGDVLGIDPSLLLLATLPLVGGLLLLSTIRAAR